MANPKKVVEIDDTLENGYEISMDYDLDENTGKGNNDLILHNIPDEIVEDFTAERRDLIEIEFKYKNSNTPFLKITI